MTTLIDAARAALKSMGDTIRWRETGLGRPPEQLMLDEYIALQAAIAEAEKQEPPLLRVYRGDICYNSTADDQSHGMWVPVSIDYAHGLSDGTVLYAAPQAQAAIAESEKQEPVAFMTDDGRVAMRGTVETSMHRAARESYSIPLYK